MPSKAYYMFHNRLKLLKLSITTSGIFSDMARNDLKTFMPLLETAKENALMSAPPQNLALKRKKCMKRARRFARG